MGLEWTEDAAHRVLDEWRAKVRALLEAYARNESRSRIAYYMSDSARRHVAELAGGSASAMARLALAACSAGVLLCIALLARALLMRWLPRRLLALVPLGAARCLLCSSA